MFMSCGTMQQIRTASDMYNWYNEQKIDNKPGPLMHEEEAQTIQKLYPKSFKRTMGNKTRMKVR